MTELEFESLSAQGLRHNLMAEADPKNRHTSLDQVGHGLHRITQRRGIAGAVREENPRRVMLEGLSSRGRSWNHLDPAPARSLRFADLSDPTRRPLCE